MVIGRTCKNVPEDAAWDVVAGLTAGQDISDREVQLSRSGASSAWGRASPDMDPSDRPWSGSTPSLTPTTSPSRCEESGPGGRDGRADLQRAGALVLPLLDLRALRSNLRLTGSPEAWAWPTGDSSPPAGREIVRFRRRRGRAPQPLHQLPRRDPLDGTATDLLGLKHTGPVARGPGPLTGNCSSRGPERRTSSRHRGGASVTVEEGAGFRRLAAGRARLRGGRGHDFDGRRGGASPFVSPTASCRGRPGEPGWSSWCGWPTAYPRVAGRSGRPGAPNASVRVDERAPALFGRGPSHRVASAIWLGPAIGGAPNSWSNGLGLKVSDELEGIIAFPAVLTGPQRHPDLASRRAPPPALSVGG